MSNKNILFIIGIDMLMFLCISITPGAAFQTYTHTALTDSVDLLFQEWDKPGTPGAALGIFQEGRIIYARGYGMANLEYDIPITPKTVFRIGSVSKQFTAMCIALLIEQGKLFPKNDIQTFLPELPTYDTPINIGHLLHHISGVRDYLTLMDLVVYGEHYTSKDAVDMLLRQKGLYFTPGERYTYANSGYLLLSEIISRVSGKKTSEFAHEQIFEPLQMNDTHFHDDLTRIVKSRASGYEKVGVDNYKISMTTLDIIGDGSIYTTIEDFFKWDQNFYHNKLGKGSQSLIDLILTRGILNNGERIRYAFGLNVDTYRGLKRVSHTGSWVGYRAVYYQFPDQQFSVVIFTNNSISPDLQAYKIINLYLADHFTEPAPPREERRRRQRFAETRPEPLTLTTVQMQEVAGVYYSDELDEYATVSLKNDNLFIKLGRTYGELFSSSSDLFNWGRRSIKIVRGQDKAITGLTLDNSNSLILNFEKIK